MDNKIVGENLTTHYLILTTKEMELSWKKSKTRRGSWGKLLLQLYLMYSPRRPFRREAEILPDGRVLEQCRISKKARNVKKISLRLDIRETDYFYLNVLFSGRDLTHLTENQHEVLIFLPESRRAKIWLLIGFKNWKGKVFFTLASTLSAGQFDKIKAGFPQTIAQSEAKGLGFRIPKFIKTGEFRRADIQKLRHWMSLYPSKS